MLICVICGNPSQNSESEYCVHCGSKQWSRTSKFKYTLRKMGEDVDRIADRMRDVIGTILIYGFLIVISFLFLWAVVAAVHWMWDHS